MNGRGPLRSFIDQLVVAGIAIFLILAVGLVYVAWIYIGHRAEEMTQEALEDRMSTVLSRLDAWFTGWSANLNVEATYVAQRDSIDASALTDRWRAMMDAYWPLTGVRLADEDGNEIALLREDRGYRTVRSSARPVIADSLPNDSAIDTAHSPNAARRYDPRQQAWFSLALQNRAVDPVWSLPTEGPGMRLSQLVRSPYDDLPYRVLELEIDPQRAGSMLFGRARSLDAWALLLPPVGDPIISPATGTSTDSAVVDLALDRWRNGRSELPFTVERAGARQRCWFKPFPLNGVQPTVGVIVPHAPWERSVWTGRLIASGGMFIILALAALLITAYVRKQRDLLRLRAEEERSLAQQTRLAKALGERDVLDREVHHRVKNNLQVVSSLLNLQAQRLAEGPVKDEFMRGKQRIDTMALVHHKLYGLPDLRGIDLREYFNELVRTIRAVHEPRSNTVSCQVETAGLKADTDTAIELGIILCELVANCYQHAFPYATGGHIDVNVQLVERDLHRLIVKDNGRGLGSDAGKGQAKLGLEIVDALAGQLDGSFHIRSNGGVTFEVLFRMDPVPVADEEPAG